MSQKVKTICFVLIALAVLAGVGFYKRSTAEHRSLLEDCIDCCWELRSDLRDSCLNSCTIDAHFCPRYLLRSIAK